jgi:GDSL-like lipase/acylhydrolase family protein
MTRLIAVLVALLLCIAESHAQALAECPLPNYLLFGDSPLDRANAAVAKKKELKIVVVGTASSMLPGRDGVNSAFPARLEFALKRRLPSVAISVTTHAKPRQTAAQMAESLEKVVLDDKPDLVIWQSGTFDALQGTDPEQYRASVAEGVETVQAGGSDVILMNMQYSPRIESMLALGGYADNMRWVAREREVPLFDRLAIMRHWHDTGAINLYAATKDIAVAKRVHDCIGQALASMIIEAARLEAFEGKTPQ